MSSVCTWFYVVTQVIQRVNGVWVTLSHVVGSELRPSWITQYLNEQLRERTALMMGAAVAFVPCATIGIHCPYILIVIVVCYITDSTITMSRKQVLRAHITG